MLNTQSRISAKQMSLLEALRQILPDENISYALHEPEITNFDKEIVLDCLNTGYVSSVGEYTNLFEEELSAFLGVKHVILVNNGTAALSVSLCALGLEPNMEVLVPSFTFVATANAVTYNQAIPHFIDSSKEHPNLSPRDLDDYLANITIHTENGLINKATNRKIFAIVPVHVFGHPVGMDELICVADKYGIKVVEDAAQSFGSLYKGRSCGSLGNVGTFSFNGNKIITTGAGGAVVTNNDMLARKVRHLSKTAKETHPWLYKHDALGFNYRMPCLNAALGLAQLKRIRTIIKKKRRLHQLYATCFLNHTDYKVLNEPEFGMSNHWLTALILSDDVCDEADSIIKNLYENKIMVRPPWFPLHLLPMYERNPSMNIENALKFYKKIINLPSSSHLVGE